MLLGSRARGECTKIAAPSRLWVHFSRIQPILAGIEFSNHGCSSLFGSGLTSTLSPTGKNAFDLLLVTCLVGDLVLQINFQADVAKRLRLADAFIIIRDG